MPHIGTVPQRGEKRPVPELDKFLRPVLELERCPNGTQHIHIGVLLSGGESIFKGFRFTRVSLLCEKYK